MTAVKHRQPDRSPAWAGRASLFALALSASLSLASCAAPSSTPTNTPTATTAPASLTAPVSVTAPAPPTTPVLITPVLITPAPTTAAGASVAATSGYLALARSAYPGRSSTTLVATGKAICATLRTDPSLHDAVGTLSGQIQGQGSADQLVRAAITAYCPDLKTR